jgi:hypothetical protein
MNYQKFEKYYYLRYQQFESLTDAKDWFDEGEEQEMWNELLWYAHACHEAKKLFDSFDDEDMQVLLGGRVPLFILEITDDDTETS